MLPLVLIFVSASFPSVESAVDKAAVEEMIRGVLHKLCPGANVCLGNQTTLGNQVTEFAPGETTCCTECSCDADCGSRGNCCFQRDTGILRSERKEPESVCIFPTLPQPLGQDRIYYQSYRMISDVPEYDSLGNKMRTAKCGDEKVAPWGAFFPVFSRKNKAIYKNSACARAANVTDGITWEVRLSCKHYVPASVNADATSFIAGLYLDRVPDNCEIQFIYPGDSSDLASSTCFEDLINTCNAGIFEIPKQLPLTRKDIKRACKSGLISPYRQHDMFANAFCQICSGRYFTEEATCDDLKNIRGVGTGTLINLIDGIFMSKVYHTPQKRQIVPSACPVTKENEELDHCRMVFCPAGQLRDENGKCVFVIKKWYMQTCSVHIKLTADKSFSIHETFEISGSVLQGNISPLVHAWPRNWLISAVSFEAGIGNEAMKNALIVEMINTSPTNDPDVLLENIQRGLKLPWSLKLPNNTLIPMTADWVHLPDEFHTVTLHMNKSPVPAANNVIPAYIYVYNIPVLVRGTPFPITRLYYCDQIQLETSEYEWYEENLVLLNKITNKTLFPGEFTTIFPEHKVKQDGKLPARICLRDSGFIERKREERVNSSGSTFCTNIMVNTFLAFICLIILLTI